MKSKVLIVDDDQNIRLDTCKTLERAGFQVTTAVDCLSGWEEFEKSDFDIVILDLAMPNFNNEMTTEAGIDFLRRIKTSENEKKAETSVLILTGTRTYETAKEALNLGAFTFFEKGELQKNKEKLLQELKKKISKKKKLIQIYQEKYPLYKEFASRLSDLLSDLIKDAGMRFKVDIADIEHRAKALESFLEKIEKKSYSDPFKQIKDLAGVRIITYYQDTVAEVVAIIRSEFEVDEVHSVDTMTELKAEEFGYRSVHLVISLSTFRLKLKEWKRFTGLSAEIQVRSILQHAWASISHMLDYKEEFQVPKELRRQLFCLNALLEVADNEFTLLRDRMQEISEGYRKVINRDRAN